MTVSPRRWIGSADAIRLAADGPDPLLAEAAKALIDNRPMGAERLLRSRLRDRPTDIVALHLMAILLVDIDRADDAIRLLRPCLALAPEFDAARERLALAFEQAHRFADGLAEVVRLLTRYPTEPTLVLLQARLLIGSGDHEAAAAAFAALLDRHPDLLRGWIQYGHLLKSMGRLDDAICAYRAALAIRPTLGVAWWNLANLKTVRFTPTDIAAMRSAAKAATDDDRPHLLFALGKACEDDGADAEAFIAYAEANCLRRAKLTYDADDIHDQRNREAALFTTAFLAERAAGGCPAPDPIFVVGLPRSGSTLVEQILASHSQVEGCGELSDLMAIAATLASRRSDDGPVRYPEMLAELTPEERTALGETYIARTRVRRHEGARFFIDKMPNNWMHVGLIRLILPNARIIDARRHPLACGWSAFTQNFAIGQPFSYDLGELGRFYRDYVAAMAHVDRVMPGWVHRVVYEAIVANPEAEIRALLSAIGLPFEPACLCFWQTARAVQTPSAQQVRQPIFTGALDHWRRFDSWLGPLRQALGPIVDRYPEVPDGIDLSLP